MEYLCGIVPKLGETIAIILFNKVYYQSVFDHLVLKIVEELFVRYARA